MPLGSRVTKGGPVAQQDLCHPKLTVCGLRGDAWCSRVKPWLLVAVGVMPGTSVRTSTMPLAPVPPGRWRSAGVCQHGHPAVVGK